MVVFVGFSILRAGWFTESNGLSIVHDQRPLEKLDTWQWRGRGEKIPHQSSRPEEIQAEPFILQRQVIVFAMIYHLSFILVLLVCAQAFVPVPRVHLAGGGVIPLSGPSLSSPPSTVAFQQDCYYVPAILQRQRKSVAPVQTMGLFGLGVPEIGVILVAAAFLLGPQKLAELGKDAGKIAGELKEVPKEFQKGLEEGEEQAKLMKQEIEKTEEKKE